MCSARLCRRRRQEEGLIARHYVRICKGRRNEVCQSALSVSRADCPPPTRVCPSIVTSRHCPVTKAEISFRVSGIGVCGLSNSFIHLPRPRLISRNCAASSCDSTFLFSYPLPFAVPPLFNTSLLQPLLSPHHLNSSPQPQHPLDVALPHHPCPSPVQTGDDDNRPTLDAHQHPLQRLPHLWPPPNPQHLDDRVQVPLPPRGARRRRRRLLGRPSASTPPAPFPQTQTNPSVPSANPASTPPPRPSSPRASSPNSATNSATPCTATTRSTSTATWSRRTTPRTAA